MLLRHDSNALLHEYGGRHKKTQHDDNVFYDARNTLDIASHPVFMRQHHGGRSSKPSKPARVPWETHFGPYSPGTNLVEYRKQYHRKLAAAKTPANRNALRGAWRNIRADISQNPREIQRQIAKFNASSRLQNYHRQHAELRAHLGKRLGNPKLSKNERTREVMHHVGERAKLEHAYKTKLAARKELVARARRGEIDTGRVVVDSSFYVTRGKIKAFVAAQYDATNALLLPQQTLTKFVQGEFIRNYERIVDQVVASSSVRKKITTYTGMAAGAAAGGVCSLVGFLPLAAIAGATTVATVGGAIYGQRHPEKIARAVGSAVLSHGKPVFQGAGVVGGHAAKATSKVFSVLQHAASRVGVLQRLECPMSVLGTAFERFFADYVFEYLTGYKLRAGAVGKVLLKHSNTVRRFLTGEDVSLKQLAVDTVDVIHDEDLADVQKKIDETLRIKMHRR